MAVAPTLPMTVLQAAQMRRVDQAERQFRASWADLLRPPSEDERKRRMRAAVYAAAGRMPPVQFSKSQIEDKPETAIAHALMGRHVTITDAGDRVAVMISDDEYSTLLNERDDLARARAIRRKDD